MKNKTNIKKVLVEIALLFCGIALLSLFYLGAAAIDKKTFIMIVYLIGCFNIGIYVGKLTIWCRKKIFKEVEPPTASLDFSTSQGKCPDYAYFIKDNKVVKGWVICAAYNLCRKPMLELRYDDNSLASYVGYVGVDVYLTEEAAKANLKSEEIDEKVQLNDND